MDAAGLVGLVCCLCLSSCGYEMSGAVFDLILLMCLILLFYGI